MQFREWRQRLFRRNREIRTPVYWRVFVFVATNLVLLSMLLFDAPVAERMGRFSATAREIARLITDLGKSGWIIFASVFLFFESQVLAGRCSDMRMRGRAIMASQIGAYAFFTVALSGLAVMGLKWAIGRARPALYESWGATGFSPFAGSSLFQSFPSGHATTLGALAAMLALLIPRYRWTFLSLGVWLAMTRVFVGAHYPSDVLAGLCLGGWFALVLAIWFARHGLVFRIGANGWPQPRRLNPLHPAVRAKPTRQPKPASQRPTSRTPISRQSLSHKRPGSMSSPRNAAIPVSPD